MRLRHPAFDVIHPVLFALDGNDELAAARTAAIVDALILAGWLKARTVSDESATPPFAIERADLR